MLANRVVFVPGTNEVLVAIPGLGVLRANCGGNAADISWINDTGGPVDVWHDAFNSHFDGEVAPRHRQDLGVTSAGVNGGTVPLGVGNDPGPRRTALLHAFAFQSGPNAPCGFQVPGHALDELSN